MRIVNLDTFKLLPSGTVFLKYAPCYFDELCSKQETLPYDFCSEALTTEIECNSGSDMPALLTVAENDTNFHVKMNFDNTRRDGCFEDNQLFAIYDKQDVVGLIEKLNKCLKSYS